jgi:hypothetical protein
VLCHGNAGKVGDRVLHAELLLAAGFDMLLFDYRGYRLLLGPEHLVLDEYVGS